MSLSEFEHLDDCEVKRLTDKAVLIEYDGEDHWIPFSQLGLGEALKLPACVGTGELVTISCTTWICEQTGIDV